MTNQTIQILNFINLNAGCTEAQIAKKFFNNRVLPARQFIQCNLWAGVLRPFNKGYCFQMVAQAPVAQPMDAFQIAYMNF